MSVEPIVPEDGDGAQSQQRNRIAQLAEHFDTALKGRLNGIQIHVVVMGPAISKPPADLSAAGRLRKELIEHCNRLGLHVTPEHKDLLAVAQRHLGAGHDLSTYEYHLVENLCDLIVIIPSSAGSLCELGQFANYPRVCKKMIILVDTEQPRSGSFVADGPLTCARNSRALIEYISYDNDIDRACCIVEREIQRLRAQLSIGRNAD